MLFQLHLIFDRVQLISKIFQIEKYLVFEKKNKKIFTIRVSLTTLVAESALPRI
jgi:hypothetical protein